MSNRGRGRPKIEGREETTIALLPRHRAWVKRQRPRSMNDAIQRLIDAEIAKEG